MWYRACHPTGKGSGVAMSPVDSDPPPSAGGLWRRPVPRGTGPAARQGRVSVSPRVLQLQTCLPVQEGSDVATCAVASCPPPSREGLRCHHMSCGSRPASRCGRALVSPHAIWLSASEVCSCIPKASNISLIMASPRTRSRQRIKCV
jgi:hypothetical protein